MDSIWRPSVEISPNCPRCGSSNTKFCYYNNYSLTQPRYFCKGCRRYWTKGGSLRNVPIGGGCRKSRRGKPWRFPNDGGVSSKGADSLGQYPRATRMIMSSLPESNAVTVDGSHIDLALVYANYLNPQPDNRKPGFEIPELGSEFDTIGSPNLDGRNQAGTGSTIMSGNHDHQQVLYSETENSIAEEYRETENSDAYVLPPLPGEEIFWTSCVSSQTLGTTQEPMFGPEPHDLNLTFANCNWSAFDLSSNDTFSRT